MAKELEVAGTRLPFGEMQTVVFGVVNSFTYTNHRGETAERKAVPLNLVYGKHSDFCPQSPDTGSDWMLVCFDLDKNAIRHFTLANIKVG